MLLWTLREDPCTVQPSPIDILVQNITSSSTTTHSFSSVSLHFFLLLDGYQLKRTGEFHGKYCLSCSFVFGYEEKLVKIHFPSSMAPSSPFFQHKEWFMYLGESSSLSFNFLPILHDLWSERPWGSSLAVLPIWWADQARPDWVKPQFSQVLIVSLGEGSVHFNGEKNRKPCWSSPLKQRSPFQVSI